MPIHHALLALLAGGQSHGYELKASFEQAVGPQWGEFNIGHVYQVLDRLEREGFVSERVVHQADRPDKTVYRLTRAGRAELERWLEAPFVREGGYRDDFFLKLFAGSQLGSEALAPSRAGAAAGLPPRALVAGPASGHATGRTRSSAY